ncbi:MAG: protein translocase subunit SecF [Peptococcaceae bacterium]|nr:protein translocase subunit SecF [Peptococcaceae bacterium]
MATAKNKREVKEAVEQVVSTVPEKRFFWQFPIVKLRYWWFAISLLVIIPGVISLFLHGLNLGIDFTGGSVFNLTFNTPVTQTEISSALQSVGLPDSTVQLSMQNGKSVALIRTKSLDETLRSKALAAIQAKTGPYDPSQYSEDKVGPSIGQEITQNAIIALLIAFAGMILYLTIRFEFVFGVSAVAAIFHDVLVVLGLFSIFRWEIDASFVAAILTVVGYSINDTVVIFDRIRENQEKLRRGDSYEDMVEKSVWQTMARSINTVLTVLITLFAIFLLGGESTRIFSLAMLIGVFSGAYSSIFNASQILVELKNWQSRRQKATRLAKSRA